MGVSIITVGYNTPVEIRTGTTDEGWTEINLLEPLPEGTLVAWNNAYYLVSDVDALGSLGIAW